MKPPLAKWDDESSAHINLVWWSRLDDQFQVEVQRTGSYTGELVIYDHRERDKELFREPVTLVYGAKFGPDVSDVQAWQDRITRFIDERQDK